MGSHESDMTERLNHHDQVWAGDENGGLAAGGETFGCCWVYASFILCFQSWSGAQKIDQFLHLIVTSLKPPPLHYSPTVLSSVLDSTVDQRLAFSISWLRSYSSSGLCRLELLLRWGVLAICGVRREQ